MNRSQENKHPSGRASGAKLVTNFEDFFSMAGSTITDASVASGKTNKPASSAAKTRQEKIKEVLGVPTPHNKGKINGSRWEGSSFNPNPRCPQKLPNQLPATNLSRLSQTPNHRGCLL